MSIGGQTTDPEWKKAFVRHVAAEQEFDKSKLKFILSTVDVNGHPAVRLVTSRGFVGDDFLKLSADDPGSWTSDILTFCTHAKSAKVQEMVTANDVQMLYWLPNTDVQIRCSGQAHMLFHPENPNYRSLLLDIPHRVWPKSGAAEGVGGDGVVVDTEFMRENAFLNHSPVIQAWYAWPPPGRARSSDQSLYPETIPGIDDPAARDKYDHDARRNYVLVFVDVTKVDIVDLKDNSRKLYRRRGDTSWMVSNINP